ncbi:MAG: phage major capsid protein [Clostridia bacterium]|nr:phage major capsid protein [Clostridia bacterium]
MSMSNKMRDLLTEIEKQNKAAAAAYEAGNKDEGNEILNKIADLRKDFEVEKQLHENNDFFSSHANEDDPASADPVKGKAADCGVPKDDARKKFFKAARAGFPVSKDLTFNNEGDDEYGGYTVPEDIVTKVERYREAHAHLSKYIRRVPVTAPSGARTFLSRVAHSAFSVVGEGGKIGKKTGPVFQRLVYAVKKFAGYIPATNELLKDSDENIEAFIVEWLGKAQVATDDEQTLAAIETKEAVALDGLDGIKHAVNVQLGQAFADTAAIYTNDDGLNYLDTLKDENGRYQLSPDPANTDVKRLQVGARYIPLVVSPNADLPSAEVKSTVNGEQVVTAYKYPFIIGDLDEGIAKFDKEGLSVKASDSAVVGSGADQVNAYEEDLTLFRGLFRADYKVRDAAAFVNGYIQVSVNP